MGDLLPEDVPFFIIGSGRSGTTLLRLIIAGHSRLHIPPETRFIHPLVDELPLTDVLSPAQVARAVFIMTHDYRWPDMEIPAEQLARQATGLSGARLVDVINLVYHEHLARAGKQRFGDKTPGYVEIVPQLATLFPGAKFIQLIRDGRDVAISFIDLDWSRYYEGTGFEWTRATKRRRELLGTPYADQILQVRYEDIVKDLENTVKRVCAFLGEEFEPAMLNWQGLTALIPERERHIHGKIAQPVSSDAIAGWRGKLSALECFAMEACLHRDLHELGYQLRFSGPGWRPLLRVTGKLLNVSAPFLKRAAQSLKRRNILPKTIYI